MFTTSLVTEEKGSWVLPAFTKGRKLGTRELMALVEAKEELQNLVIAADVADEMRENGQAGNGNGHTVTQPERTADVNALYEDEIPF